jgi:hypothetical protein
MMNAANLSRTPLGRALLHVACIWRHPAAVRFFLSGLKRNLREWQHHRAQRRSIP